MIDQKVAEVVDVWLENLQKDYNDFIQEVSINYGDLSELAERIMEIRRLLTTKKCSTCNGEGRLPKP